MFFSMARLSLTAAALVLPIHVQAVAFTVDSFKGIAVGEAKNLTWSGDGTPVTIKLMQGPPEDLETVVNLASNVAGDHYTWTPKTLAAGTYVLSITQGSETNYSPQFSLTNSPPPGAPPPIRAGTKPPTAATAALALPGTTHPPTLTASPPATAPPPPPSKATAALALPPSATHPPLVPYAPIAAYYYPPAAYTSDANGSRSICEFLTADEASESAYSCVSSVTPEGGEYEKMKSAARSRDGNVAVGAGVVGLGFAVLLVL